MKFLASLMALCAAQLNQAVNIVAPHKSFRSSTPMRRTRRPGDPNPAGSKIVKHMREKRLGIRGNMSAVSMWALERGVGRSR